MIPYVPAIAKTAADLWREVGAKESGKGSCWEWPGRRDSDGYGTLNRVVDGVRYQRAHRLAYRYAYGPIPDGLVVMHKCDNPPCCNPAHLRLGTAAENNADMLRKGRERYPTGSEHWARRHPELVKRGAGHYLSSNPEARDRLVKELKARAKLSDEQVAEMRSLYAAGGWTFARLAERYGISTGHAHAVVRGRFR